MGLYDILNATAQGLSTGVQAYDQLGQRERAQSMEDEDRDALLRQRGLERALLELQIEDEKADGGPTYGVGADGRPTISGARTPEQIREFQKYNPPQSDPDVNWTTVQTDDGYVQVHPRTGATRPVQGPAGAGTLQPKPPQEPRDRETVVMGPDGGYNIINLDTGVVRPVGLQAGARPTGEVVARAARNRATVTRIDQAIQAIETRPESLGLQNIMPELVTQRTDPGGVEVRALLADIGSMVILDRSGAAVAIHEMQRLQPFIPSPRDTPQVAITKLRGLKDNLEAILAEQDGGTRQQPEATNTRGPLSGGYQVAPHPDNPYR